MYHNGTRNDNDIKQIESIMSKVNDDCDVEVVKLKKLGLDEESFRDAVKSYKDQYNKKLAILKKELENTRITEQARLAKRLDAKSNQKAKMSEEKMKRLAPWI